MLNRHKLLCEVRLLCCTMDECFYVSVLRKKMQRQQQDVFCLLQIWNHTFLLADNFLLKGNPSVENKLIQTSTLLTNNRLLRKTY